jgi:hypothetical protein
MKNLTFISCIFLSTCLQAVGQSVPNTTYEPKEVKIHDLRLLTYPVTYMARINAHSGLPEDRLVFHIIEGIPVKDIGECVVDYMNMPDIFYPMSPSPVKQV